LGELFTQLSGDLTPEVVLDLFWISDFEFVSDFELQI